MTAHRYDAFISYSHEDRGWVGDWLVPVLRRAGLTLCVDADDFEPGALSIVEMERAVVESAKTIVVLTPAYVKSRWTTFEHSLAQTGDPAAVERRVVPVLRATCQLPPRLAALVHLDFTTPERCGRSLPRLIQAIRASGPLPAREERSEILESPEAKTFLQYVKDRYQYLDFRGMGVTDRVPLRLPLTEMYVPLKARLELPAGETWSRDLRVAGRAPTGEEAHTIGERLSEPRPVVELLSAQDGVVVLGDPGAGKTTILKYIALRLASGDAQDLGVDRRLPLVVPLSAYANALASEDLPLGEFIARYYRDLVGSSAAGALVERALSGGAVLLLLDGLDEVHDPDSRRTVVDRVFDFLTYHRQAGNKFMLTSRIVGYRDVRRSLDWVAECTLVDFDDEEIDAFVEKWTGAVERAARGDTRFAHEQAVEQRDQLRRAIEVNPGVRGLAANPLLLTILALMLRQGVSLPERRVELYQKYVETLLKHWNLARSLGTRRGSPRRCRCNDEGAGAARVVDARDESRRGLGQARAPATRASGTLRAPWHSRSGGNGGPVPHGCSRSFRIARRTRRRRVRVSPPDLSGVSRRGGDWPTGAAESWRGRASRGRAGRRPGLAGSDPPDHRIPRHRAGTRRGCRRSR